MRVERKAVGGFAQPQRHADAPLGALLGQQPVPRHVAVAAECGACAQVLELSDRFVRHDAPLLPAQRLRGVHLQSQQVVVQRVPGQAVAVGNERRRLVELDVDLTLAHAHHVPERQTGVLGRVERTQVVGAPVDEVVAGAAVEVALRIGLEAERGAARRCGAQVAAAFEQRVEQPPVVRGDVLHVAHVLVAALDLEAAHTGAHQCREVGALVVVLDRQHMLLVRDHAAQRVGDRVGQPALLRATAAVGAAAGVCVADEALAGVGHAERAVDEELQHRAIDLRVHRVDLLQRELARQDDLGEAGILQEAGLLRRTGVALRAGVQLDRRQVDLKQRHVLHDQRVDTGVVQVPGLAAGAFELVVAQDGVQRDVNAGVVAVGVRHQSRQILDRVRRLVARAERRPADVDGVCAVVDGLDADVGVARRR
jgi:hypothetical protein